MVAARNTLIVFALAGIVYAVPGGGEGAGFVAALLSTAITATLVAIGYRLYREHRLEVFTLGDQHRGLLYGAVGALVFAFAGAGKLFDTAAGTLLWIALVAGAVYALVAVFRYYRSYSF